MKLAFRREGVRLVGGLVLAGLLAGGAGGAAAEDMDLSSAEGFVRVLTGSPQGTWPPSCAKLSELMAIRMPNVVVSCSTGSVYSNMEALQDGNVEMIFSLTDALDGAYNGTGRHEGNAIDSMRYVASLQPIVTYAISRADAGVESVADILTKPLQIAAFTPGSGTYEWNQKVFKAYGTSLEEFEARGGTVSNVSYGEGFQLMKDGQIDLLIFPTGVPASPVIEAEATMDIVWHPLSGEARQAMIDSTPGASDMTLGADVYESLGEDYETVGTYTALVVSEELSDEIVYGITAALWDNLEEFQKIGAFARQVQFENALHGRTIPLHPGAERYYREKGVLE